MSRANTHGVINHDHPSTRKTDYLYRVSLKCLGRNERGEILVVRETGRKHWDLPGGGMDHHEALKAAIAREMKEEVNLTGDFSYKIIAVDEPAYLSAHNFWQIRLVFAVTSQTMAFSAGEDGDEIAFMAPGEFANSQSVTERKILAYSQIIAA